MIKASIVERHCYIVLFGVALICSCQHLHELEIVNEDSSVVLTPSESYYLFTNLPRATIGDKKVNPLSLENVIHAFEEIPYETRSGYTVDDLQATHHYIAFTPTNDEEQIAVHSIDENQVVIHYYPLDYEVSDGLITLDERFSTNGYSYYWAYVPVDFDLTSVGCPYVFYYDIVALDDDSILTRTGSPIPQQLAKEIYLKTCELCGVDNDSIVLTRAAVHPSGYVKFYDIDYGEYRPVEGFKVRAVRGTHHCYMNCNASGYFYSSDTFTNAFQYEFMFRRDYFEIRLDDASDFAVIKLSGQTGPVDVNFADDATCFMATIDRAAITYYYGNNCGLRRPPIPSGIVHCPIIKARTGSSGSIRKGLFSVQYFGSIYKRPIMTIYRKLYNTPLAYKDNYASTIHELAHASLWFENYSNYEQMAFIVDESFARGVEWAISSVEYPSDYAPEYYRRSYTGLIQDLIDGPGEQLNKICYEVATKDSNGNWVITNSPASYNDIAGGMNIAVLESAFRSNTTWSNLKASVLAQYPSQELGIIRSFYFWDRN